MSALYFLYMRRVLFASALVSLLMPALAYAQTSTTTDAAAVRIAIEADLKEQGVDKSMSADSFKKLVDALSNTAVRQGITAAVVSGNLQAKRIKDAPPLAVVDTSGRAFDMAAQDADSAAHAASQEQFAIVVAGLVALALFFGIWRRHKHLQAAKVLSERAIDASKKY